MLPLIDAVAKATILLALAGGVTLLLRRASAASRHLVWTVALLAALAAPVLSLTLPRWQLPIVTLASASAPDAEAALAPADMASQRMAARLSRTSGRAGASDPSPSTAGASSTSVAASISWRSAILLLWIIGATLVAGRLLVGLVAVRFMSRKTDEATNSPWLPLARALSSDLGISSIVFRRNSRSSMPMAWGVWRPTVLMPACADAWPQDRLRIVLLHELAHVKRRDCLTHMLAQLACAVYWFNPLAWVAAKRVRAERERACDDLVLAAGTPGADYATQLLDIARVMRAGRFPAIAAGASLAMAHRSQLEGRLMAILDPSVPRSGVSRMRTLAVAAVAAFTLIPLASLQPWTYEVQAAALPQSGPDEARMVREQQQPMPDPGPQVRARDAAKQEAVQGVLQGALHGSVQGATQGAIQGAMQGSLQGSIQGAIQSALPAISGVPESDQEARAKADPKLVAALTAALKDTDKEVREAAMHALVQMRDPSIFEPLVQALKDAAPDVREQAAFGLGQMRDKRAVEPLIAALKDTNADVREQAAFALGQLRDRAAVDALGAAIRDTDPDVREQVVFALGQLRDPRSVEALISSLKDANGSVREQSAFALGQLRAAGAVEALIVALKDTDPDVREQAAFALGQIRDPRAIDGLTMALKDSNASVRQQAAFALGQLAR